VVLNPAALAKFAGEGGIDVSVRRQCAGGKLGGGV